MVAHDPRNVVAATNSLLVTMMQYVITMSYFYSYDAYSYRTISRHASLKQNQSAQHQIADYALGWAGGDYPISCFFR